MINVAAEWKKTPKKHGQCASQGNNLSAQIIREYMLVIYVASNFV